MLSAKQFQIVSNTATVTLRIRKLFLSNYKRYYTKLISYGTGYFMGTNYTNETSILRLLFKKKCIFEIHVHLVQRT